MTPVRFRPICRETLTANRQTGRDLRSRADCRPTGTWPRTASRDSGRVFAGPLPYSTITAPLCGATRFTKNISGMTARKITPSSQKLSTKAFIMDCCCTMP
jgi:hypothetical protein